MIAVHSPKFAANSKSQLIRNKLSPTQHHLHTRAPSMLEHYSTPQAPPSPSNRPRSSQSNENNPNLNNQPPKAIINSLHILKEQYKTLKDAYKQLINQRVSNAQKTQSIIENHQKLQTQLQKTQLQNERLRQRVTLLEQDQERTRKECGRLLQAERFRAKRLEESLIEKEQYINQTIMRMGTEEQDVDASCTLPRSQSLVVSQDKSILYGQDRSINNQSQFLSFSLTSVMEESSVIEHPTRKEHIKACSQLPVTTVQTQPDCDKPIKARQPLCKAKKETAGQGRVSKQNLNLVCLTRGGFEKKSSKSRGTKSFRRREEEAQRQTKKKSRKIMGVSGGLE